MKPIGIMDKQKSLSILKQKHVDLTAQFEARFGVGDKSGDEKYYFDEDMAKDRNYLNALRFVIKFCEKGEFKNEK